MSIAVIATVLVILVVGICLTVLRRTCHKSHRPPSPVITSTFQYTSVSKSTRDVGGEDDTTTTALPVSPIEQQQPRDMDDIAQLQFIVVPSHDIGAYPYAASTGTNST